MIHTHVFCLSTACFSLNMYTVHGHIFTNTGILIKLTDNVRCSINNNTVIKKSIVPVPTM